MVSSGYHRRHYNPSLSVTSSSFSKLTNFETLSVPPPPPHPHHNLIQNPSSSGNADSQNPDCAVSAVAPPLEDVYLSNSSHLTRLEVVRRRAHNVRQLTMVYRDHYWAMMEELKAKYKEYVWKYGSSPYKEDDSEMGNISKDERGLEVDPTLCVFYGCTLKAMALTKFCHLHILSDSKQVLYKPCEYVIKSAQAGPITCGRPILRARVPVFCNVHLQKAHRALKKAGLHVSSSSKLAPKFHLIVAEYVRQIQAKRRAALGGNINNVVVKREGCN